MLVNEIPILTTAQIAQALDRAEEVLEIPEWGGAIKLKAWSLDERDRVIALATVDGKPDPQKIVHLLVIYGVTEPRLTEADIQGKNPQIIDRIANAVMRLNAMTKEAPLTASMTFRPEPHPDLPVPPSEGPGENGAASPS